MKTYAQIDDRGICIGICQLSGEVEHDDLVEIPSYDDDYLWRKYDRDTGEWSAEKYEPDIPDQLDEITRLKLAMAEMAEAHETERTELQLAIAELADLITQEVESDG